MPSKSKAVFVCSECGYESPKWSGRCPACGEWNTMNEEVKASVRPVPTGGPVLRRIPRRITELNPEGEQRYQTGMKELDRVLGGGIVKGGLMLIGGDLPCCCKFALIWDGRLPFCMCRERSRNARLSCGLTDWECPATICTYCVKPMYRPFWKRCMPRNRIF